MAVSVWQVPMQGGLIDRAQLKRDLSAAEKKIDEVESRLPKRPRDYVHPLTPIGGILFGGGAIVLAGGGLISGGTAKTQVLTGAIAATFGGLLLLRHGLKSGEATQRERTKEFGEKYRAISVEADSAKAVANLARPLAAVLSNIDGVRNGLDGNSDGVISLGSELQHESLQEYKKPFGSNLKEWTRPNLAIFERLDVDTDGNVTQQEIESALVARAMKPREGGSLSNAQRFARELGDSVMSRYEQSDETGVTTRSFDDYGKMLSEIQRDTQGKILRKIDVTHS